jgi:hypothetical protein
MNRKNILKASLASLLLTSMVACKKDNDIKDNNMSKAALLSKAAWVQTAQEFKTGAGNYTADPEFADAETCEKDNLTVFKANKTYEENEGASKCDASDPTIVETGTWDLVANETELRFVTDAGSYEATIERLDGNTLQLVAEGEVLGEQVAYRFTFSH